MEAIHQLESISEHIPSDENQAIDFIYKLDNVTFAKFRTELDNMVNSSGVGSYPATVNVNEAYRRASRHKEEDSMITTTYYQRTLDRAAFHINDNNNNSSSSNNNENNDNGNGSDRDDRQTTTRIRKFFPAIITRIILMCPQDASSMPAPQSLKSDRNF
eukprot:gene17637-24523_t